MRSGLPCGMNLAGRPSTSTQTSGAIVVHLVGDRHPDATVADAVLARDDGSVGRGIGDHRRVQRSTRTHVPHGRVDALRGQRGRGLIGER